MFDELSATLDDLNFDKELFPMIKAAIADYTADPTPAKLCYVGQLMTEAGKALTRYSLVTVGQHANV